MPDKKITLTLTENEARALLDGWAFALGPLEMDPTVRKIVVKMWATKCKNSMSAVESVTDKLTTILDGFLKDLGVDVDSLHDLDEDGWKKKLGLDKISGLDWDGLGLG